MAEDIRDSSCSLSTYGIHINRARGGSVQRCVEIQRSGRRCCGCVRRGVSRLSVARFGREPLLRVGAPQGCSCACSRVLSCHDFNDGENACSHVLILLISGHSRCVKLEFLITFLRAGCW